MPNNDLAALSAAATQGEWRVEPDMRTDVRHTPEREEYEYLAGYDIRGDIEVVGCEGITPGGQAESNASFITALVNEYRAGRLVQIDEGMREATARAEAAEAENARLREALRRYANVYGVLTDSDREYIAQALGAEHGK